ncbi:hypothetical protein SAMN02745245_00746 [Anaerosphaera aminiphila DSM 21120]|uniref:DUF3311 domain-containing protein n=1 Tax=Anaerosphaera aminiphila DSM 21120 TaxID=1120995 RepID=A0A1M5QUS5_9FIRM|nr:hypothetical protein [Anaerosphaera aminiphila]SHH17708.1 hypothetical protein SAMN02745245_00746 [Anaerosphaera aminiphila DSM 21120]
MKNKIIIPIFVVLFILGAFPFKFTAQSGNYLFGWLPVPLAFWWLLMIVNLVFVLIVSKHFVNVSERESKDEEEEEK